MWRAWDEFNWDWFDLKIWREIEILLFVWSFSGKKFKGIEFMWNEILNEATCQLDLNGQTIKVKIGNFDLISTTVFEHRRINIAFDVCWNLNLVEQLRCWSVCLLKTTTLLKSRSRNGITRFEPCFSNWFQHGHLYIIYI